MLFRLHQKLGTINVLAARSHGLATWGPRNVVLELWHRGTLTSRDQKASLNPLFLEPSWNRNLGFPEPCRQPGFTTKRAVVAGSLPRNPEPAKPGGRVEGCWPPLRLCGLKPQSILLLGMSGSRSPTAVSFTQLCNQRRIYDGRNKIPWDVYLLSKHELFAVGMKSWGTKTKG